MAMMAHMQEISQKKMLMIYLISHLPFLSAYSPNPKNLNWLKNAA